MFGYWISDTEHYGAPEFDKEGNVLSLKEKPKVPKSNYAVVGLYIYPNKVVEIAKNINFSARGELEITTVNQQFLEDKELKVQLLGKHSVKAIVYLLIRRKRRKKATKTVANK